MKKLALALVVLAAQAGVCLAGGPVVSSKEIVAPPAPPESYFLGNEFVIGAFGTYVSSTHGSTSNTTRFADGDTVTLSTNGNGDGWGGGMDFTYFLPWKYLGFRFQGAGVSVSSADVTGTFTNSTGTVFRTRTSFGSGSAGIISGDIVLRLPLDDFWPGVHLAPYTFGGGGGIFTGAGGNTANTPYPELNRRLNNASSNVENDRGQGHIGGGLEYRFTRHIGIFAEADYNWVGGGQHNINSSVKNFVQTNFGLRFAF